MRRNEFASGESKANRWRIIIMIFNASRHRENCKGEGKTILQMLPDDRFLGWHFTSPQVENIEVKIAMQRSPAEMKLKSMFLWDDLQRLQMWDCKCRGHQMTDNHRTKYSSNWAPLTSTQGSSVFRPFGIFDNFSFSGNLIPGNVPESSSMPWMSMVRKSIFYLMLNFL